MPQLNLQNISYTAGISVTAAILLALSSSAAFAADTVSVSKYLDTDFDGTVDTIRWTMDETVTACAYEAGDWTVNTASEMNIAVTGISCTGTDAILDIAVSADAGETGATTNPVISYANVGTAGSITLASGAMSAKSSITATDGAAPTIKSISYRDSSLGGDGKVDQWFLLFTEIAAATSTFASNNLTVTDDGDFDGFNFTTNETDVITSTQISLTLSATHATVVDTHDDSGALTVSLIGTFNLDDAAGNSNTHTELAGALDSSIIIDDAAPVIKELQYKDVDGNGKIDTVTLIYSEEVTDFSRLRAADLIFDNVGDFTGMAFGSDTTDLITAPTTTTDITLGTEATVVDTSEDSGNIDLNSQNLFQLHDSAGNLEVPPFNGTYINYTDHAAPVVISVNPTDDSSRASIESDLVITFSEAMDTTFTEGTEFSISPDPGAFVASWTDNDSVLRLTAPLLSCETEYTVTTDNTVINAASGNITQLATTGPSDGDWSFTTSCSNGGDDTVIMTPENIVVTNNGPVCESAPNTYAFTITGDNLATYIVSGDIFFLGSSYQAFTGKSMTINYTLSNSDTAYFLFKSSNQNTSNLISVQTEGNWETACDTDVPDEEPETPGTLQAGDIAKGSGDTVYYITETGRRVFMNEATYFTWFDSFNDLEIVSDETLAELPLEGIMLPKAEVVLVKIQSDPRVYFLENGTDAFTPELRHIVDEATAITLFGTDWADYVIDIEPTFFYHFENGTIIDSTSDISSDTATMKKREALHG